MPSSNSYTPQPSAFERYLLSLPRDAAVYHVIDCLRSGPQGNAGWDLMERFNGEWKCPPDQLPHLVLKTIESLADEVAKGAH